MKSINKFLFALVMISFTLGFTSVTSAQYIAGLEDGKKNICRSQIISSNNCKSECDQTYYAAVNNCEAAKNFALENHSVFDSLDTEYDECNDTCSTSCGGNGICLASCLQSCAYLYSSLNDVVVDTINASYDECVENANSKKDACYEDCACNTL